MLFEVIMIGIGLSMDATAISMSNGMVYDMSDRKKEAAMPLFFGVAQAVMPILGYFTGSLFAGFIQAYANIAVFLILGGIGASMVWSAMHKECESGCEKQPCSYRILFLQAIATSIDAFAVGIGFAAMRVNVYSAAVLIGLTTAICSWLGILLGKKCGDLLESKAEALGGGILILIGVKALLGF